MDKQRRIVLAVFAVIALVAFYYSYLNPAVVASRIYLINEAVYNIFLLPVIFFSVVYYILAIASIYAKREKQKFSKRSEWPFVTIQIPVYNDPIAVRCIRKCLAFDYPKDRFEVVVADDSDDVKTRSILDNFAKGKSVSIIHRNNRKGFKAGALNNALRHSLGEYIVIFDSDFVPQKNFLKGVIRPFFSDEKIAVVQSRMDFINYNQNIITKFASMCLMVYHNGFMPVNNRIGSVFFCGTGGAIKKSVLEEVGGWHEESITEDADLSIRILDRGYRHVYLPGLKAKGEVPFTLDSFLKQQQRWAYGTTRAFADNWKRILFGNFSFFQKLMITFLTIGYIVTPFVVVSAITGQLGWLITPAKPFALADIVRFFSILFITSGFIFIGALSLYPGTRKDLPKLLVATFTLGIVLAFANMVAFFSALFRKKMTWIRTPKFGNSFILRLFSWLFRKRK